MEYQRAKSKKWMKGIVFLASIISLMSGIQYLLFPQLIFRLGNLKISEYTFIWQSLGALNIVFALILFIAFFNLYRHWASILLVLLSKLSFSIIFIFHAINQPSLWGMGNYIFIENLLWVFPLGLVLHAVYKKSCTADDLLIDLYSGGFSDFSLDLFETNYGDNLLDISKEKPVLLLFLRHFGCTFCRETMQDVAEQKQEIEKNGSQIIVVHMLEDEDEARMEMAKFGLENIPAISDPESILYKMFKLKLGSFSQLFGPKVMYRAISAGIFKGLGIGTEKGDIKQMPGVFLLHEGEIVKQFIHKTAADRPNYVEIATFEQIEK